MYGSLRFLQMYVNQVADEAQAEWDAVGQQVKPGLPLRGLAGHVAHARSGEQIADDLARIGQVTAVLTAEGDHGQGDDAADDDRDAKGHDDRPQAGGPPEEGPDPRAKAHLHLDITCAHAA